MKTLPLSEAKAKLSRLVDEVNSRDERVTITRNGRPAAVILSSDEIESLEATLELLQDPDAMAGIRRGLRDLRAGRVLSEREIEELFGLRRGAAAPVRGPRRRARARNVRARTVRR